VIRATGAPGARSPTRAGGGRRRRGDPGALGRRGRARDGDRGALRRGRLRTIGEVWGSRPGWPPLGCASGAGRGVDRDQDGEDLRCLRGLGLLPRGQDGHRGPRRAPVDGPVHQGPDLGHGEATPPSGWAMGSVPPRPRLAWTTRKQGSSISSAKLPASAPSTSPRISTSPKVPARGTCDQARMSSRSARASRG
jgi:hypothetical protein